MAKGKIVTYVNEDKVVKSMLSKVREVEETTSIDRVNELLKDNWILLAAYHNTKPNLYITFSLGKLEPTSCN